MAGKTPEQRVQALELSKRPDRNPPIHVPAADDLPWQNSRLRTDDRALLNAGVISEPDLAADDHVILDDGAPRNPGLSRDDNTPSDSDVVRNLHEVVDLAPRPNVRGTKRPSVDRRIGADLDIGFYQHSTDTGET